jgi:hypothetical protein
VQVVYYPDDPETVTIRLVPTTADEDISKGKKDEYGLPVVRAHPVNEVCQRRVYIADAKWAIPTTVLNLDSVDPFVLVEGTCWR